MAPTQGEDVGVAGPRHVVLLDGLVERGLAEEQEAQANPGGQQPGHVGTEPAGRCGEGGRGDRWTERRVTRHGDDTLTS